jgi:hypothetical protein
MTVKKLTSTNAIEAANRAEVTAILIRAGYRVYRPEADVSGEDLVIRIPDGELRSVQMKARPLVHWKLYGGKDMWMLFPDPTGDIPGRPWFFIKHDELFNWFKEAPWNNSAGLGAAAQSRQDGVVRKRFDRRVTQVSTTEVHASHHRRVPQRVSYDPLPQPRVKSVQIYT